MGEKEDPQVIMEGVTDEDAIPKNVGYLRLNQLERQRFVSQVMRTNTAVSRAVVCDLLRLG